VIQPPVGNSDSTGAQQASVTLHAGKGSSAAYQRHEPEKTVLYKIVSEHLETFLGEVGDHYDKPLPKYVEKELRDYLRCGLLQHGFLWAVCKECGRTILVAFSCKKRGACCSCAARRMCNGAAHLVDHVIPDVPVRQWVLSVPFELRLLLACRADAFGAMTSLFISEVFRWQRERAREDGLSKIRYGALVMQHRFGSSLNLNTHLHAVFPDGVFSRSPSGEVEFNELRQPAPDDLEDIAFNVHQRFLRWLRRHGLLKNEAEDGFSNESPEPSALEACAQGSLGLGNLVKTRGKSRNRRQNSDDDGFEQSNVNGRVGASHGYSLYGLFGPHSSWRKSIVPEVAQTAEQHHEHEQPSVAPTLKAGPNDSKSRSSTEPTAASTMLAPPAKESKQETRAQDVGPRFSAPWRIDWATLLKRV